MALIKTLYVVCLFVMLASECLGVYLLLSDVADNLSDRRLNNDLHLTAFCVGAPAAPSAALEVTDDAYYFLHGNNNIKSGA